MTLSDNVKVGLVMAAALVVFFTRPSQSAFEQKIDTAYADAKSSAASGFHPIGWITIQYQDHTRVGEYKAGIVTSTYTVKDFGGSELFECTGYLTFISCSES